MTFNVPVHIVTTTKQYQKASDQDAGYRSPETQYFPTIREHLGAAASRFRVLSGDSTYPNDGYMCSPNKDERKREDKANFIGDIVLNVTISGDK